MPRLRANRIEIESVTLGNPKAAPLDAIAESARQTTIPQPV